MSKHDTIVSLVLNLVVVIIEAWVLNNIYFGFIIKASGPMMFRFFTEDSNCLAFLSCLLLAIFEIRFLISGKKIPHGIFVFKYVGTLGLVTTFLVVLLYLSPMVVILYHGSYFLMFGYPSMLFTHGICPILCFVSFFFFEKEPFRPKKEFAYILIPVLLYAIIVGCFASLHLFTIENVYGFMDVTANPWLSVVAMILIPSFSSLNGYLVLWGKEKKAKRAVPEALPKQE